MRDVTGALPRTDGPYSFARATPGDGAEINRLLAENPMDGPVRVSLEHAPDPFAADFGLSDNHVTILARYRDDRRAVGFCERTTWDAFVNGVPSKLPYLGALRVAQAHRSRIRVLRGGFAALRDAEHPNETAFALTSISEDNAVAKRVLTAGIAGLPVYRPLGRFTTLFLRSRGSARPPGIRPARSDDLPRIADFLNRIGRRRQFAPVWTGARLETLAGSGLRPGDFLLAAEGGEIIGCAAVWDQSGRRQAIVRGYEPRLGRLRPFANAIAPFAGLPRLPAVGERIPQAALSHLAAVDTDRLVALVGAARDLAHSRRIPTLFLGLPAGDPGLSAIRRRMRAVTLTTGLYAVHWPDTPAPDLDPELALHPEAGLM